MKLRVVIAHDYLLLRNAIGLLLSCDSEIEIIGESSCNAELVHLCREVKPDILLTYIPSQEDKFISLISEIKVINKAIKILAITEVENNRLYLECYKSGINGIVDPNSSQTLLIKTMKTIFEENIFVKIYNNKMEKFDLQMDFETLLFRCTQRSPKLTPREKEVLMFISEGLTTKEISEKLMLSKRTVDYFRGALIQKLHVNSTAGLIKRAIILNSDMA